MAMLIDDVKAWLADLPDGYEIAIDEGGLSIVLVGHEDIYLEIGGVLEVEEALDQTQKT